MSQHSTVDGSFSRFFTVREPVRMDLALHGPRFIISEFILATLIAFGLAGGELALFFLRDHAILQLEGGIFFLSCAVNALTFLALAIAITRRHESLSRAEYPQRMALTRTLAAVIFLLVPLLFPILAAIQGRGRRVAP
jgi:hypothetical protein